MAPERIIPTFIGIGVAKCGTTWLSECLRYHPEVFMSIPKELHFFSNESKWNNGLVWYLKHFNNAKNYNQIGEFSTTYIQKPVVADRIINTLGKIKIIVSLRSPVDRFISHYKHFIRSGRINEKEFRNLNIDTLQKVIDIYPQILENGNYYKKLKIYVDKFGHENVCILIKEDFDEYPERISRNLYNFLKVNSEFVPPILYKKVSPTIIPIYPFLEKIRKNLYRMSNRKLPWIVGQIRRWRLAEIYRIVNADKRHKSFNIDQKVIERLYMYYKEDIYNIERFLGRELVAWKKTSF